MTRSIRLASSSASFAHPSNRGSLARAVVETIEQRCLLASVSGVLFNDANANGTRQSGEAGLVSEVVYADLNNNNTYDGTDFATRTDANGAYKLSNLPTNGSTLTIRVRGDAASRVVSPAGNGYAVKFTTSSDLTGKDFAVKPVAPPPTGTVIVSGRAYLDHDFSNTFTPGDTTTAGAVYLDLNRNFIFDPGEPSTMRNASDGTYTLAGVPAGSSVRIAAVGLQNAPEITTPASDTVTGVDVFSYPPADATRVIPFSDSNGDGSYQSGEPLQQVLDVWSDDNHNGVHDAGEQNAQTLGQFYRFFVPQVNGTTTFSITLAYRLIGDVDNLADGSQFVQFNTASSNDFTTYLALPPKTPPTSSPLTGRVTNDANGNGVADSGEAGLANEVVYLDRNNNGLYDGTDVATRTDASGNYTISNVALNGSTAAVRLRGINAPRTVTAPASGAYVLTLSAASTKYGLNFSVSPTVPTNAPKVVTVSGRAFVDHDFTGTYTANDPAGVGTVFADLNANGKLDAGEPSTTSSADGLFTLAGVPANQSVTLYASNIGGTGRNGLRTITTTAAGTTVAGVPVYGQPLFTSAAVVPFVDTNGDGQLDNGETFTKALDVWTDDNGNGIHDAGEQTAQLSPNGTSYTVLVTQKTGGAPTVIAYRRVGDNDNVADGTATVYYGSSSSIVYFAIPSAPVTVSGRVFDDANRNGLPDAGESGLANVFVYADYNGNGTFDFGDEPNALTNSAGSYSFTTKRGAFTLRIATPSRQALDHVQGAYDNYNNIPVSQISPAGNAGIAVDVTSATSKSNVNFGAVNASYVRISPKLSNLDERAFFEFIEQPNFTYAWVDTNGNGVRDASEPAIVSTTGYEDDPTQPHAYGYFYFLLARGTYQVDFGPSNAVGTKANGTATVQVTASSTPIVQVSPTLPTLGSSVFGHLFYDDNLDGTQEASEKGVGLSSYSVFADYNGNGLADAGEPTASVYGDYDATTYNGYYFLTGLDPTRTFTLRIGDGLSSGFVQTNTPRPVVGTNQVLLGQDVGVGQTDHATITGRVGNNVNNGSVAGITVYADYNGNGVLDANEPRDATIAAGGGYTLKTSLSAFTIRLMLDGTNYVQTSPTNNAGRTVDVRQLLAKNDQNFVVATAATVNGRINNDANLNGQADNNEPGLAGVTVFADYDGDGTLDNGEPTAVTNSAGTYSLKTIPTTFQVRISLPTSYSSYGEPNFLQTGPSLKAGRSVNVTTTTQADNVNFSAVPAGFALVAPRTVELTDAAVDTFGADEPIVVWLDKNKNGVRDADEPIEAKVNAVGDAGASYDYYAIAAPADVSSQIDFGNSIAVGAKATTVYTTTVAVNAGGNYPVEVTVPTTVSAVTGTFFNDLNHDGVFESGERISGDYINESIVFADYNNNGVRDAGEPEAEGFYDDYLNRADSGFYLEVDPNRSFTLRAIVGATGATMVASQYVIAPNTIRTNADVGFEYAYSN